jgi:hypothetical protein
MCPPEITSSLREYNIHATASDTTAVEGDDQ